MKRHLSLWKAGAALALVVSPVLAGCDTGPGDPFAAATTAFANGDPRTAYDHVLAAIEGDPDNPAVRLLAGDIAMAMGNPDRAISEYERVPESAPEHSPARARLAEAQVMGNYLEAARETIATLEMDNPSAFTARIAYHLASGEVEAAFTALDEGLAGFPEDPLLITVDAERLWAQGKAQAARDRLEPVLAIRPAVAPAHLFAGQLRLAERDARQAEEHFEQVLSVRPTHQTAMLALAAIARDRGDTQTAGNWIDRANEAGNSHPVGLLFAAQMAYDAGDLMRAFELIEMAPPSFAGEPQFARLRGMIDAARGEHAMAAHALNDYVEETGGDPMARRVLASSLAETGEFDAAWDAIEPVIDHPQSDAVALSLALGLAEETGKGDKDRIARLLARRQGASPIMAEMREASAAIRAGDWAKADRIYAPLLAGESRNDPALLNNAAAVKTRLGEHDAAVRLARRAYEEAPQSPEIMDTLGWALWHKGGSVAEARKLLDQARRAAPRNREIAEHWAIVHAE